MTTASRHPRLFARCCVAFALGALVGPYIAVVGQRQTATVGAIDAGVLAIATAAGVLADGAIKRKLLGVVLAAVALCALGGGLALLIIWLVGWTHGAPDLIVTLAVALAPAVAGFTLSHVPSKDGDLFRTATLTGMVAWLGIDVHFVAYLNALAQARAPQTTTPANTVSGHVGPGGLDMVGFVLTMVSLFFMVGFVYAAGAGLLGAGGRRALAWLIG